MGRLFTHLYNPAVVELSVALKILLPLWFLLPANLTFGQKKFPKFSYVTIQGDTVTNSHFIGRTSMVIMGHISCPAMFMLLRDIEKSKLDTVQFLLLLENTKEQIISFNTSTDSANIWAVQRKIFNLQPIRIPTVVFCKKEKIKINKKGTVRLQNQCNNLKMRYRAINSPTLYAVDNTGKIIQKSTGWYLNSANPDSLIIRFLKGIN